MLQPPAGFSRVDVHPSRAVQTEALPSPPHPSRGIASPTISPAANPRPARKKGRNFRKLIPWLLGAAVISAIVLGLRPKPTPVEIAAVDRGPLAVSVLEEGRTRIRHRYTISLPVSGHLQRVELRAGDRIEVGKTVLAAIRAEAASLLNPRLQSEAEARVKGAEAALNGRESDLERVRTANDFAQKERARTATLRKSGSASAREADTAENEAAVRARELRSAEFALQVARFELQQAEATLLQAQNAADPQGTPPGAEPLRILAPVSGYVLNVFEESARVLPAGTPIMEVGDATDLEAEIELLSTDAAGVRPGADVAIEKWGGPNPLRATVRVVEPAAFTKISALGVEEQRVRVRVDFVDLPTSEHQLGDRYRVEARIITWSAPDVLRIPTGALFRRGGDWMCFLADTGCAQLQRVQIAHNNGIQAEVLGGVSAGQRVILHPPDAVTADSAVKPRE